MLLHFFNVLYSFLFNVKLLVCSFYSSANEQCCNTAECKSCAENVEHNCSYTACLRNNNLCILNINACCTVCRAVCDVRTVNKCCTVCNINSYRNNLTVDVVACRSFCFDNIIFTACKFDFFFTCVVVSNLACLV